MELYTSTMRKKSNNMKEIGRLEIKKAKESCTMKRAKYYTSVIFQKDINLAKEYST